MDVCMEGPLSKWTNVMKGWQYRWFVLDDNAGLLSYYTSKEKMIRGARRGCVRLQGAIIGIDDEEDSTFTITVDQKVFHFQARDSEERKQWVLSLEDTILRHNQRKFSASNSSASLADFDRRLAEADSYLQLLIENVKGLESKLNAMDTNVSNREELEEVLTTAQEMVEAVKKSVVLLQLAKMAVSANSTTPEQFVVAQNLEMQADNDKNMRKTSLSAPDLPHTTAAEENVEVTAHLNVEPAISVAYQSFDNEPGQGEAKKDKVASSTSMPLNLTQPKDSLKNLVPIPSTSYSSSEDEGDEFFDADEGSISAQSKGSPLPEDPKTEVQEAKGEEMEDSDSAYPNSRSYVTAGSFDAAETPYEKHVSDQNTYESSAKTNLQSQEVNASVNQENENNDIFMHEESYNETEGESLEEHKSVIMHLLSQVKLGMDLTKVVLPTFILEKRSLLEMYADFFSHPDYFLEIAQKQTPEERMIACVRFYLSTFSAGRNSSVAKKPYNPIQGEFFQCFWTHPAFPTVQKPPVKVTDGPVPWAQSNQLCFIAEQVSHHPPVSAFYAEHKDQRIQFNGHIWTKSKFLGLSVGVHNIGQGCVRLLDLDEEYILTFPNGYGRSILTVPWFELGGDCTITCEKTGYNAIVKFHTKPFYGGKIHRVTGEIYKPNVKKPLCTIEGEWNTVMFCNYLSGKSERFVDAKRTKTLKRVKKIDLQEPSESRRLWQVVTANLKANNIDKATEAKRKLEDKQRSDAKMRLENNIVYKPKFFHEDDLQNWIYNKPLTDRT